MLDKYLHNVIDVKKFLQNNAHKGDPTGKPNSNSNISDGDGNGVRNDASKVTTTETVNNGLNPPE
jgi:hypothetical protein